MRRGTRRTSSLRPPRKTPRSSAVNFIYLVSLSRVPTQALRRRAIFKPSALRAVILLAGSHHIASPRNNIQSDAARNYLDPSDFVFLS
jgi:hypothetical protein